MANDYFRAMAILEPTALFFNWLAFPKAKWLL
jgi:hypothetical protein